MNEIYEIIQFEVYMLYKIPLITFYKTIDTPKFDS